ncbi:aldo/keto reductase [Streptomyces sp. FXJ1.4098]|nr:aldo/keto reductase [Streptomyces sp. FXJ1.4098]
MTHPDTPSRTSPGAVELPGVPVPLSRLVLGTMTFGDTVDRAGAAAMLDAALDAGVTGVDTANAYAGGVTETILAELLPGRRTGSYWPPRPECRTPTTATTPRCPRAGCGRPSKAASGA